MLVFLTLPNDCVTLPRSQATTRWTFYARPLRTPFYFGRFAVLGIELPLKVIKNKLRVQTHPNCVHDWYSDCHDMDHVWTNGSVQLNTHAWLTIASFAVIRADETAFQVGRVSHWRRSSYTAELWAAIVAFASYKHLQTLDCAHGLLDCP